MTEYHAKLLAEVDWPHANWGWEQGVQRTVDGLLIGVPDTRKLIVHNVQKVLAGDTVPVAEFPAPWVEWDRNYQNGFAPDLAMAFFPRKEKVTAVDAQGATRWIWTAEDGSACRSVLVARDQVWVVVGRAGGYDWAVLDARDGTPAGRVSVLDWGEYAPEVKQLSDGRRIALELGFLDFTWLHWARTDDEDITAGEIGQIDAVLNDLSPDGRRMFLTMRDIGDVEICGFPDAITEWDVDSGSDWYPEVGGFLDDETVLAMRETVDEHWLMRPTGQQFGRIHYPSAVDSYVRPLGDGTWLTGGENILRHWTLDD